MYQIAYGTNSPTQSARAIQRAVEISIAQLLPVLWISMQAAILTASAALSEEFRGRHPCADALELFDRHTVEAALAARFLDRPHHHPPDERRNPLHTRCGRIVPRDRCRRFAAVFNQRRRLAEAPKGRRRTGPVSAAKRQKR